jgi:sec-independent protein translocase protein TatC
VSILARRRKKQPSKFERAADGSMTLMEHLRELRSRLFKACLAILIGIIVAWFFAQTVLSFIQDPYCELALKQTLKAGNGVVPADYRCPFVNLKVTDPLLLQLKISLWTGLILASPFWLYQLWAFIAPGLHRAQVGLCVRRARRAALRAGRGARVLRCEDRSGGAALLHRAQHAKHP